jgi:hypothetical protein
MPFTVLALGELEALTHSTVVEAEAVPPPKVAVTVTL